LTIAIAMNNHFSCAGHNPRLWPATTPMPLIGARAHYFQNEINFYCEINCMAVKLTPEMINIKLFHPQNYVKYFCLRNIISADVQYASSIGD